MSYQYLKRARKIICIGRNYAAHIKELNNPTPKQPFFFLKPSSSIITPISLEHEKKSLPNNSSFHGLNDDGTNPGPIYIPRQTIVNHEIELALVMDKYISNVTSEEFLASDVYDAISGVALALDLTARNVQDEAKKKGLPWSIGKGFDTFLPISQFIPKDVFIKDKEDLQNAFRVTCSVNGELRQDDSTRLMLNPLHKIIQHISTMISLEPGDIILTGTPSGVGPINPADEISGELYYHEDKLVDMKFSCETRPGPYVYRET
ncbi:hypothetical protein Kpol_1051p31 [Vanderwaltozyma polyspora DSM 70294]|uniref:oxaloacetate tautomerase n=1 Tax=Vanderwaltozyma polyspora (strain ATCC 22028 / DSM 70294 / BCRC 21397 / CBS 2163 / NBRC 10782 / NRRL Y-8283 / UCD 57-17) TaxID=436907 RepID=A7TMZ4_VANPO|nr:uncharacterized protein Kpol_1051p31 [Vanderwaltozyma polyspora DSM 70294]EDO16382.1 hypothetical protein Kpol_1051p31 [Vanderwaltozyma polyspora DSM 70294]